jgi:cytidylate kinase
MIVTISREYGASGMTVAHRVGDLLGYPVVGDDLPKIAALRLGTTRDDVVAVEHRAPSLAERILNNLGNAEGVTTIAPSFESEVRREIETAVLEAAQQPDVVIIGGIANVILRGRPNLLSVFLHAPKAFRINRVGESLKISPEEARKEVERVDAARKRWAKLHYDLEWGHAEYYSMTLDVARVGVDGAVYLIANAASQLHE